MSGAKVSVTKVEGQDVTVSVTHGDNSWEFTKPFADFREFSQGIKHTYKAKLPSLPSKPTQSSLDEYVQAVAGDEPIWTSVDADIFFEIHAHVPLPTKPTVIVPVPDDDFDPTETAVPWKLMKLCGFEVVFATEEGKVGKADHLLTRDEGVVFGALGAADQAKQFYFEMEKSAEYQNPIRWADIVPANYHGLLLGGGHAPKMKQYLESQVLKDKIAEFWLLNRPVAAICHGVLLLSRCKDASGKPLLHGKQTTTLPKYMEKLAYSITAWKHGSLYRTYKDYCETEVRSNLAEQNHFSSGPTNLGARGSMFDDRVAFIVEDGHYISARWPGDSYLFGKKFIQKVQQFVKSQ